jgi:hypothetical protein
MKLRVDVIKILAIEMVMMQLKRVYEIHAIELLRLWLVSILSSGIPPGPDSGGTCPFLLPFLFSRMNLASAISCPNKNIKVHEVKTCC